MAISVHVLAKNSVATIAKTLDSLQLFPEVIVVDTGSTDETPTIASQFKNVIVHPISMTPEKMNFGWLHNYAAALASTDWILSIDSDEVPSPGLVQEILSLKLSEGCVYSILRENYLNGKEIRHAGWKGDRVIRLYHRKATRFSNDLVHEKVISKGLTVVPLRHKLQHTSYGSIGDFLDKMQLYSTLFALQYQGKKQSSLAKALFHAFTTFLKNYLWKLGIFGGKEGLVISLYNAQTTYYKYLKLAELNKKTYER